MFLGQRHGVFHRTDGPIMSHKPKWLSTYLITFAIPTLHRYPHLVILRPLRDRAVCRPVLPGLLVRDVMVTKVNCINSGTQWASY